jgi:DNA-directed RNA polymerase subunit H (RpoH/RPB5)
MELDFRKYCSIRTIIIQMLYDRSMQDAERFHFERGSLLIHEQIPLEIIQSMYDDAESKDNLSYLNMELKNHKQRVVVVFVENRKSANMDKLRGQYQLLKTDTLIAVVVSKNRLELNQYETSNPLDEIFWYKQLTFNVSKHNLVPKHELLHPDEHRRIKRDYLLNSPNQLPTILNTDPVAKYYGMYPGDICRIIRHNENIGTSIFYRQVVPIGYNNSGTDIMDTAANIDE